MTGGPSRCALPLVAALTLLAAPSAAQPAAAPPAPPSTTQPATPPATPKKLSQADRDAARALAEQGFEKLQARQYDEAIDLFTRAEERIHAPPHLFYIAQAQAGKGLLLEAADTYRKVLAETLPRDAPEPFRTAQDDARAALPPLIARTPKLRVEITGTDPTKVLVEAAGRPLLPGTPTAFNPGTVLVTATPPGGARLERLLLLTETTTEVAVRFDLTQPLSLAWPIAALGVGAAAGGAAIALGVVSRDQRTSATKACREVPVCPQEQLDKVETAATLRDAAIVTGIAAGAFLVTGVTLFLVRPKPKTTVDPPEAESPTIALRATPSFIALTGSF